MSLVAAFLLSLVLVGHGHASDAEHSSAAETHQAAVPAEVTSLPQTKDSARSDHGGEPALQGFGTAPPPPDFIYIRTYYYTTSGQQIPPPTSTCVDDGIKGIGDGVYGDYYCWDTVPGNISELWVRPA